MTTQEMADWVYNEFINHKLLPYDTGKKWWRNPKKPHMKDLAIIANGLPRQVGVDTYEFIIGNEEAENRAPQYHILEDAKIIRRPNKGTDKSRGSQRLSKGTRDYGQTVYRLGTQESTKGIYEAIQEYRQNITRNYAGARDKAREYNERIKYHHENKRNYRYNEHYLYIEAILGDVVARLAQMVNGRLKITQGEESLDVSGYLNDEYLISPTP
ncbi:MAG: hypothetical protein M0R51_09755 [Clostridia bacterium]|jgi:hypothetical protein|nr:hypothetical protein [Clostridia bacterium]